MTMSLDKYHQVKLSIRRGVKKSDKSVNVVCEQLQLSLHSRFVSGLTSLAGFPSSTVCPVVVVNFELEGSSMVPLVSLKRCGFYIPYLFR